MKENRLVVLISTFKEEDWSEYQKFSRSRYGDATDHKTIIDYLKKNRSKLNPKTMGSEYFREKIRPEAKPIVFSNVVSQLCRHVEAYFVLAEVKNDPMMEDTLLLQAFANRGLTDQFHKHKKKAVVRREKMPLGLWEHYHEFVGEYLEYYKRMTTSVAESKVVLENCVSALTQFGGDLNGYLGVEMHNREKVLAENWDSVYKDFSSVEVLEINDLTTLFHFYKKMKEKRDWDSYTLLKEFLHNSTLSKELEYTTVTYLRSFLNYKSLHSDEATKASLELVELFTYGLSNNVMYPNKNIPLNSFATIIRVSAYVGDYEWADNFISSYSHFVSDKNEEQIKSYGYAHLFFLKGNYNKTIEILRSKKFSDFIVEVKAKWLLLVSLYELNPYDTDSYKYYTDSLKSYLKRNKEKTAVGTFIAYSKSIVFLKKLLAGKNLDKLEFEIKNEKSMIQKKWFLEKINGL